MEDVWYRCEVKHYSVADEYGDHAYTSVEVLWTTYAVVRTTPKGVWLKGVWLKGVWLKWDWGEEPFFVLGTALRQRACPTQELALQDAIARKERHIEGCKARLASAMNDLQALKFEAGRINRNSPLPGTNKKELAL